MSVYCIVNQTGRLSDPTKKLRLDEPLAYSNQRAHSFRFTVLAEGSDAPATLTGVGVTGQFLQQGATPNTTVEPILGTVNGNVCEVILPAPCYSVPGRFKFTMDIAVSSPTAGVPAFSTSVSYAIGDRVVYNSNVWVFTAAHTAGAWVGTDATTEIENRTVLWVEGIVERNTTNAAIDPGTPIPNVTVAINNANAAASAANAAATLANGAAEAAEGAAEEAIGNFAPAFAEATANAAGSYVTYTDGKMYLLPNGHTANTTWANTTKSEVKVGGELTDLKDALTEAEGDIDDLETAVEGKQDTLTFDTAPTANSTNPVTSGGIKTALDAKQNTLTFDNTPTSGSNNPVKSGGIYNAIEAKYSGDIETAVDAWLDEHPEATTTVEDGSLTEAKFEADTLATLKNNYATPEMFGAKGDGTTDDSEAIQNMFDSDYSTFMFSKKTYKCCGIEITKSCNIIFDDTTITYSGTFGTVVADFMIAFKANKITTSGELTVNANNATAVGILVDSAIIWLDNVYVLNARIWGVYCTGSQIGQMIGRIKTAQCGKFVTAKAKYKTGTSLDLTNIEFTNSSAYSSAALDELFNNAFSQNKIIVDDSGYDEINGQDSRVVFYSTLSSPVELDSSDKTIGVFSLKQQEGILMPPSGYVDGENGRNVFIPVGGGVAFNTSSCHNVEKVTCQTCPVGIAWTGSNYGISIQQCHQEYVTLPFVIYGISYSHAINHLYLEAVGTGYQYSTKKSLVVFSHLDSSRITVLDQFISSSIENFMDENETVSNQQGNSTARFGIIRSARGELNRLYPYNVSYQLHNFKINEKTPSDICVTVSGFVSTVTNCEIAYKSLANLHRNQIPPTRIFLKYKGGVQTPNFTIGLSSDMVAAGYTISGATNNVYTITFDVPSDKIITIVLYEKVFYISVQPVLVTSISSTSTDAQYPSAKCVYDLIGDVETLLAGV